MSIDDDFEITALSTTEISVTIILKLFVENYIKMKEFRLIGGVYPCHPHESTTGCGGEN